MKTYLYRRLLPYSLAIASTAIALLLTLWLEPLMPRTIGAFFYIAIIFSTWFGGFQPGVVVVVLSTLAIDYFFIEPHYQIFLLNKAEDLVQLGFFVVVALTINLFVGNLKESKQKIAQLNQKLIDANSEQMRMVLSATQTGMWDWNLVTGEITWSPDHAWLLGLDPKDFDGKYETFDERIHPQDRQGLNQALQQALQTKSVYHHEFRVIWPDGSIHWVQGRGHGFYDEIGKGVRMAGTIMNIDDRKQAEIFRHQQFEQQRLLMEMIQRIRQSLNLQDILQTTVEEVRQFLQTSRVIIFKFQPDYSGSVIVESVDSEFTSILSANIFEPDYSKECVGPFKEGLYTAKSDIYSASISDCHLELLESFQIRANLVVPIMQGENVWGLLIAHHCGAPREWQTAEIELLRQLSAQASIAIQQADLFEQVQAELRERKLAEIALQENEQKLQLFIKYAPASIVMLDRDMHYIAASQRWVNEFHLNSVESIIGRSHYDLFPNISEEWKHFHQRGLAGCVEKCDEDFFVYLNGSEQWLHWEIYPWYRSNGDIGGIILFTENITERKQAQIALQNLTTELEQRVIERTAELTEVNKRLQQSISEVENLYNHAPCGYHSLDATGTIVMINDTELNWLGYTRDEILHKKKFVDLITEESKNVFQHNFPLFKKQGLIKNLEFQMLRKNGSNIWINVNATAIYDEAGNFLMSRSSLFDISDRKLAEEILQQYERIISNTTDGIAVINRHYIYQIANQSYLNWCNKSESEVVGNSVRNILGADLFDQFIQPRLDQCLAGEKIQYEKWFDYPNLVPQFLSVTYAPLRDLGDRIVGVIVSLRDLTQLKKAEQMLELQAVITRNMAEGICLVRGDNGLIVYANPKFEQMFGYDADELNGQHVSIVNYASESVTAEEVNQSLRTAILQKGEFSYEIHNVKKDGTPFWCSATTSVFNHSEYGNVLVAVHQDITERKEAEAILLQKSRQEKLLWSNTQSIRQSLNLHNILNTAVNEVRQTLKVDRVAVYRFNPDWSGDFVVESVGENWVKLVGVGVGKIWEDTYLEEHQGGRFQNKENLIINDIYQAGIQTCYIQLLEQFQAKSYAIFPIFSGKNLWGLLAVYQNANPRNWQSWEIELLEQIASQLSIAIQQSDLYEQLQIELQERKQGEAKIREANRRWRFLLENVQLIVVGLDTTAAINYVNPCFLKMTGYTESEVLGKNLFETFISPAERQQIETIFSAILAYNSYPYHQNSIVTKSGEGRLIAWNNTLLKDSFGKAIGTISIGEDITERQKIEKIKDEFIGIVSHELRTPLTAIQMSLGLIQTGVYDQKPEKIRRMLEIALIDTNRLVNLVNDILDLERLDSGRSTLEKTICQVTDLVQQAIDVVQAIATKQLMTITFTPTDIEVLADGNAIVQTLTNLLSNAIKFSPTESTIYLSVEQQIDCVLFQVCDRGRGIPADKLELIFGRFQQVDASDSREKGGTGLGLAICQTIIEKHGGKIWAESILGEGSNFFFTLPLA